VKGWRKRDYLGGDHARKSLDHFICLYQDHCMPDADRISRFKTHKLVSFISTVSVCLVLATVASADSLVVLLEGLGGQITSRGIVLFKKNWLLFQIQE
jgi:hypothetical protein